ncbi:sugar ABC transporter permease [Clostridium sp. AF19-22AC]|jgi:multiple sugar transport system permease protein|uniref:Multiple sugar transport system permease protein n=1 Tax=Faecalicatena orotica TaxID=1544 RepID=A0A2Y9BK46_9FIRM|nr:MULTISPECIES: sugar ABC transporter permease [Clostridia]PWJ21451.1 multiple sugar transport system permease protein [Faecalicatena orotica]RHR28080.1 sugar ABC transporter permease [Clostridium sp. AF19-22AC]SSA58426.1 multiple sugar transport system permease protein [Faecalicatena orotica]
MKKKMEPWLFLLPVLVILLLLFGYPLINSIIMAFQNYKLTAPNDIHFNGLDNFAKLMGDPDALMIIKNSFIYVIVSVLGQFLLGMTLAVALKKQFKGRGIYQSIVFLPWAFSGFVVGLIFRWSFNGEYGVVNNLLDKLGLIDKNIAWLGTPGFSLAVVIIAMIWMGIPFFAIMILAALQSIPTDVYEAADVDGCGTVRQFFQITLPYIKPTLITTILLRTIWIFNSLDLVVIITDGGPANTSQTLPAYMYSKAFGSYDFGFAAALGVILMIILGVYAMVFLKATKYDKAGDF